MQGTIFKLLSRGLLIEETVEEKATYNFHINKFSHRAVGPEGAWKGLNTP